MSDIPRSWDTHTLQMMIDDDEAREIGAALRRCLKISRSGLVLGELRYFFALLSSSFLRGSLSALINSAAMADIKVVCSLGTAADPPPPVPPGPHNRQLSERLRHPFYPRIQQI